MPNIKTITPVHISNGETFFFLKQQQYIYSLDTIMEIFTLSREKIQSLIKMNNPTRMDFINLFQINPNQLTINNAVSSNSVYGKNILKDTGKMIQAENTLGEAYIPGSSLKGAFVNVFWFYVIQHNEIVRNDLIKNLNENNRGRINKLDRAIQDLRKFLIVNDIYFHDGFVAYELARYNKKNNTTLSTDTVETIDKNQIVSQSIVKELTSEEKDMLLKLKIKLQQDQNERKDKKDEIILVLIEQMYDFIIHFTEIFPIANREYMEKVIKKELEYVDYTINKNVDKQYLQQFYQQILSRLKSGEIIMQIGKYTNYIDKTAAMAFGKYYNDNFKTFAPNPKKKSPTIDSMNLVKVNNVGKYPFGFIQLEL